MNLFSGFSEEIFQCPPVAAQGFLFILHFPKVFSSPIVVFEFVSADSVSILTKFTRWPVVKIKFPGIILQRPPKLLDYLLLKCLTLLPRTK